ncbi:MAG: hypothetical protein GY906_23875 [bacterium]|nr:hypothetical protein [bacterium]
MLPTKIFLDLDDVLAEFTMTALRHVGCRACGLEDFNPKHGFDIVAQANAMIVDHPLFIDTGEPLFTVKKFWEAIPRSLWAELPRSKEFGFLIVESARLVGRENVCVLTAPIDDPECAAGKMEWMKENLPVWLRNQFLIGSPKHLCASPDALLIDDSDKNVDAFLRAGGQAILVPRPWNSNYQLCTKYFLEMMFQNLFAAQKARERSDRITYRSMKAFYDPVIPHGHVLLGGQVFRLEDKK